MGTRDRIHSVTDLKTRAAALLRQVNEDRRPVIITQSGEARAVLLDSETYDRMRTAIGLLKLLSHGEEAARTGRSERQADLFRRLEGRLRAAARDGQAKTV